MQRQPVQSSNIAAVAHDPHSNTLEVQFHSGKVFQYGDVNVDEFRNLLSAKSVGSHFHAYIKSVKNGIEVMQ